MSSCSRARAGLGGLFVEKDSPLSVAGRFGSGATLPRSRRRNALEARRLILGDARRITIVPTIRHPFAKRFALVELLEASTRRRVARINGAIPARDVLRCELDLSKVYRRCKSAFDNAGHLRLLGNAPGFPDHVGDVPRAGVAIHDVVAARAQLVSPSVEVLHGRRPACKAINPNADKVSIRPDRSIRVSAAKSGSLIWRRTGGEKQGQRRPHCSASFLRESDKAFHRPTIPHGSGGRPARALGGISTHLDKMPAAGASVCDRLRAKTARGRSQRNHEVFS